MVITYSSVIQLLDRCLEILDPELYGHLLSKRLSAEIYAFPSVLTFCACTPPLDQVLQLWDFLLAYGVHLNVLCVIAQLFLMRESLMSSQRCVILVTQILINCSASPMKLLRTFPPLDARNIIGISVTLVRNIPAQLYDELTRHPWDMAGS
jgi:cell cycle arrest protein BUB2